MSPKSCNTPGKLAALFVSLFVFIASAEAQLPTANFTATPISGCAPLVVVFTDLSSGSPTAWSWDFGNGAGASSLQNPTTTYFNPGTYAVTLTVTNANGSNTLTRTQYITVYEPPTVDFSGGPLSGCFPLRTQFTDNSSAGAGNTIASWLWDFGNGTQATTQNPFVVFTTAGNYTVSLKVTNDKGCSKVAVKPNYIQVTPGVVAGFSFVPTTSCRPPAGVAFTDTSTGPGTLSYQWSFGDGNNSSAQNPSNIYNTGGTFQVTLVTTSSVGCVDTIQHAVNIPNNVSSMNVPDSVCVNATATFLNNSTPASDTSIWDFGDGNSAMVHDTTHAYNTVGTYTISLINTYPNCRDTITKPIRVLARPVANFTAPVTTKCEPNLMVNFQDASTGAVGWEWHFGDGGTSNQQNPNHNYTAYGSFDVTLIVTNASGCTDTITKPQFVIIRRAQIVVPAFPARGCVPYSITLSANVTALDAVTSWFWDFGDGFTSTSPTPSHTYTVQGSYTVKVYITTSTGCTDSLITPGAVRVGTHTTPAFSATPLQTCAFQPVQFTDLTPPPVDEWLWYFGDGATSPLQTPSHAYTDTGYFSVTLVSVNSGCPDSLTIPNYIHVNAPIADFSAVANCGNRLQFTFTDQSTGPITTWLWDFGDGTTSTAQNPPLHTFPALGTYQVTLTVSNATCTHSITYSIRALDEPVNFTATPLTACKPSPVTFTPQNITVSNIASYYWDFGNGTTVTTASSTAGNNYPLAGIYTITLVITDINGCKDTIVKPNYIHINGPTARFTTPNFSGCKGMTVNFTDLSTSDGTNAIVNWQFDFGDGNTQNFSAPPFQHQYNQVGTFSVRLRITDASGCIDSFYIPNLITTSDPHARFTAYDTLTCPGALVNLINQSPAVNPTHFWDLGDGTTATTANTTHIYTTPGIYPIKLVVTDQYGCADSSIQNVRVDVPRPSFTISDSVSSCIPFEVDFTNTSQYYSSVMWDFGQGGTSSQNNPIVYYSIPGTYLVKLYVTSPGGCVDSAQRTIILYDTAGAFINYAPLNGCKPFQINLNAFTQGPGTYIWDYGDGTVDSSATPNATHIYNTFGDFVPKMILLDPAGCLIPLTGPDTVRILGATAKFGFDNHVLCDSGRVTFIDSTTFNDPITSYNWDFGDGGSSTIQNPVHDYTIPGLYTVSLAVQTLNGCRDSLMLPDTIRIIRRPLIDIAGDTSVCINDPMTLNGIFLRTDTSVVHWQWTFPNGNTSTDQNPLPQVYGAPGTLSVTTIATNSSGCKDTTRQNILIYPLPTASMPSSITTQIGFPITIPAIYSLGIANYSWMPASSLDCPNCPQPQASPKINTNYTVSFVDSNGCRNSASILVVVICKDANVFMPNTFSPNGDGVNDKFYPRGKGIDRAKVLRIFNRWGQVVFEAKDFPINDPNFGWDGIYKGNKQQAGVYIYQVEFYCDNGDLIRLEGNVALIL